MQLPSNMTPEKVTRTNVAPNGGARLNLAGWTTRGGTGGLTRMPSGGPTNTWVRRDLTSDDSAFGAYYADNTSNSAPIVVSPNTSYTLAVSFATTAANTNSSFWMRWKNSLGQEISSSPTGPGVPAGTNITATPDGAPPIWTRHSQTVVSPAGAATLVVAPVVTEKAGANLNGEWAGFADLSINTGSGNLSAYFDGNKQSNLNLKYRWSGTEYRSTSQEYEPARFMLGIEPKFGTSTEQVWSYIPHYLRDADANNGYVLKSLVNANTDVMDDAAALIDNIDYTPLDDGGNPNDSSALVDPLKADLAWLPWVGQLFGVSDARTDEQSRQAIAGAAGGFRAGTQTALSSAAQTVLVGSKFVKILPRTTDSSVIGGASQWDITIVTRSSETLVNLVPKWAAASSTSASYTYNTNKWIVDNNVVRSDFYGNKVPRFTIGNINAGEYLSIRGVSFPVYAGDPINFMYGMANDVFAMRGWNLTLDFYNGNDVVGSFNEFETDGDMQNKEQFITSTTVPANATTAVPTWTFFYNDGWRTGDRIYLGELGARRESTDLTWLPETSNPVKAVYDSGAAPAGMKLYNKVFQTTWDAWNNAGYNTWNAINGKTWTEMEEIQ